MFAVHQQQPTGALEHGPVFFSRLAIQFSPQVGELLVEQFDDMKVIEHNLGLGQPLADGLDVGLRHVHGHGLNLSPRSPQTLPKRLQGLAAFALADEYHRAALQIQDHRQIVAVLPDRDFRRWQSCPQLFQGYFS